MFEGVPKTLKVLFSIIIVFRLMTVGFASRPWQLELVPVLLLAFFMWRALSGKEFAAKFVAVLLTIGAVADIYQLIKMAINEAAWVLVILPWDLLLLSTALYIFKSKELEKYYIAVAKRR